MTYDPSIFCSPHFQSRSEQRRSACEDAPDWISGGDFIYAVSPSLLELVEAVTRLPPRPLPPTWLGLPPSSCIGRPAKGRMKKEDRHFVEPVWHTKMQSVVTPPFTGPPGPLDSCPWICHTALSIGHCRTLALENQAMASTRPRPTLDHYDPTLSSCYPPANADIRMEHSPARDHPRR